MPDAPYNRVQLIKDYCGKTGVELSIAIELAKVAEKDLNQRNEPLTIEAVRAAMA